jgi:quercetin dioxygenase-like cupin family protein
VAQDARPAGRVIVSARTTIRAKEVWMAEVVVRKRGEGKALWALNGLYDLKATSDQTDGAMTVGELTVPAGGGPPPHTHPGAEAVYVLEGRIRYQIGDQTLEGGPGDFFYIPDGILENFDPVETSRLLVFWMQPGMTEFFEEVGEPAQSRELPPESEPDIERIMSVAQKYGVEMKPPEQG